MPDSLRIGFAGTPTFAATLLQSLIDNGFTPELVLTQPDRPTGRGRKLKPSPVKTLALDQSIPVDTPIRLKGYALMDLDLLIVAAYGLILPPAILASPRLGCLNVHASLLPRWRGAAPVERAIMAGDNETGVCLMQMDAGLDTGPVFRCSRVRIDPAETGGVVEARLADAGARLLVDILPELPDLTPTPQPAEGVTYAEKLIPADSVLDWSHPAPVLARQIQALADRQPVTVYAPEAPEIGGGAAPARVRLLGARAISEPPEQPLPTGTIIQITRAGLFVACGSGQLCVSSLQLNRGKGTPMTAKAAANGYSSLIAQGQRFLTSPELPAPDVDV